MAQAQNNLETDLENAKLKISALEAAGSEGAISTALQADYDAAKIKVRVCKGLASYFQGVY